MISKTFLNVLSSPLEYYLEWYEYLLRFTVRTEMWFLEVKGDLPIWKDSMLVLAKRGEFKPFETQYF